MSATAEVRATKRITHADQILGLLKKAGPKGCTTELLCQVTHRFSARIWDLKSKGWDIETVERTGTDCCHFVLKGTVDAPQAQPDMLQPMAPARPSSGFDDRPPCSCGHPAAWHRNQHGGCMAPGCACTSYVKEF